MEGYAQLYENNYQLSQEDIFWVKNTRKLIKI